MLSKWYRFFPHCLETLNATCYIPIVGTIMNLRVYERHTSIAWAQMSLTLLSRVLVSDSNGDNKWTGSFGFWYWWCIVSHKLRVRSRDVSLMVELTVTILLSSFIHYIFVLFSCTSVPERPITANLIVALCKCINLLSMHYLSNILYYCPRRDFVQRRNPEEAP